MEDCVARIFPDIPFEGLIPDSFMMISADARDIPSQFWREKLDQDYFRPTNSI